jgi:hypothetical protein
MPDPIAWLDLGGSGGSSQLAVRQGDTAPNLEKAPPRSDSAADGSGTAPSTQAPTERGGPATIDRRAVDEIMGQPPEIDDAVPPDSTTEAAPSRGEPTSRQTAAKTDDGHALALPGGKNLIDSQTVQAIAVAVALHVQKDSAAKSDPRRKMFNDRMFKVQ